MTTEITLRHIQVLAGKRGFRVIVDAPYIHVSKKSNEHLRQSFDLRTPFRVDLQHTQQFTFFRIYLWIRGYDLFCKEENIVQIQRARHHPAWDSAQQCETQFVYRDQSLLFREIAWWVHYLETHRCLFMEQILARKRFSRISDYPTV